MKGFILLLMGLCGCSLVSGFIAPPINHGPHIEKYGKKIGPAFLEEEMKLLWESKTISRSEGKAVEVTPQFTASTKFGGSTIIGKTMLTDLDQREIYAWQGFRYGKAIDKNTRFKPAIQEDNVFWTGDTFEATQIGFKCPQQPMVGPAISGKADCLYLNIYTPYIPDPANPTSLPVMFFVHGGGFVVGDASMYLPTKLLNHDVILVTIHYRLGAQGFWTLQNSDAPGNQALSDQILALKWVRENIDEFGGDPDKITVFGESAGSVSVNYILISELTRGQIAGVIAESGSVLDNWAVDLDPSFAAMYIANYVGCNTTDATDEEIFHCMLDVSDEDLVRAELSLISHDRSIGLVGFRGAAPIIQYPNGDETHDSQLVVTKHPREYFLSGEFNDVPFMTGANKNEGSYVFSVMYFEYLLPNGLEANALWLKEQSTQQILKGIGAVDETYALANLMDEKYCPGVDKSSFNDSIPCMIDMNGVLFLKAGSWQTCKYHTHFSTSPAYYYSFEFMSADSMYTWIGGDVYWDTGVTHSDELMYLFSMPYPMVTDESKKMERIMTLLWTNFATYGEPTPDSASQQWNDLGIPKWAPFLQDDSHYILIENRGLTVRVDFSERWTVSMDELNAQTTLAFTDMSTDSVGTTDKTTGTSPTPHSDPCSDIQHKSDAYEATMIVFIVFFVIACAAAIYFFFKARK